jgi:hypothetical protein
MNRKLLPAMLVLVLMLAFAGSAFSDDSARNTVGFYVRTQTAPEWKNWIAGVGVGFWLANKELINSKRAPLFCFPGPDAPDPKPVLDAWIAKERAKGMIKPGEYFGDGLVIHVALLVAYEDAFSCTAKGR